MTSSGARDDREHSGASSRADEANPARGCAWTRGNDYDEVRDLAVAFGYTAPIMARGDEAQAIKRRAGYRARRWVVERTHSWMNRFRRILTRWEKKLENYLGLLHLVCAWITYRSAGLLG